MIDWVIGKPTGQEAKVLREALDRAAEAALYLVCLLYTSSSGTMAVL